MDGVGCWRGGLGAVFAVCGGRVPMRRSGRSGGGDQFWSWPEKLHRENFSGDGAAVVMRLAGRRRGGRKIGRERWSRSKLKSCPGMSFYIKIALEFDNENV
ncbi:hypothetical protein Tco_1029631 [Tanacetum coccineum]|uniref:Uncharacterized protein n=1 Tax=Tanacetum coccineum TaxID=301880 RepID=A0ABQ5G4A0_9ASTR